MPRLINKIHILSLISLLLIATFLAGCNSGKTPEAQPSNNPPAGSTPATTTPTPSADTPSSSTSQSVKITLYFPNSDASGLIPVERTVQVANQEVIKAMFTELSSPPAGLESPLPKGTTLLNATVKDGVATLDLSGDFKKNFGGGSSAEVMTMYSIVNTLTTLSDVHSVQFLLEGKKLDGILGSLDTSAPLTRNDSLISKTN
ncbi:GerMN domain-containing protein [Desulfosporosinus sp. PR]|uniref:GerMN domain-containing protein n=1 Tax=Candidatus Desulfosporosinus nitrosoreducens TaxID=3401928 RepID=UPI0027FDFDE9|nr:GerMN domain-containing protein [Desulfosporosinus sp. PR]MDQ7096281.1 GerMN domain-containing protein [Desulfosporosinus sp. PR]